MTIKLCALMLFLLVCFFSVPVLQADQRYEIEVISSFGNPLKQFAHKGSRFGVKITYSGEVLELLGAARNPDEIMVENHVPAGRIGVSLYKNGMLIAMKSSVMPGKEAVFNCITERFNSN